MDADLTFEVTTSNLRVDERSILKPDVHRNKWNKKTALQISLTNPLMNNERWLAKIKYSRGRYVIRDGWTKFCRDNILKNGDMCKFRKLNDTTFQLVKVVKAHEEVDLSQQQEDKQPAIHNLPKPKLPDIQQMVLCKQQEDLEEQPAIDKIQQVDVCQRVELTDLCRQQKQTIMGLEQEVAALKSEGEKLQHKIMELWKFYGGKHQPTPSSAMKQHQYTPSFAMTQKPTPSSFMKQQPTSLFAMTQKKSEETPTLGRGRTKAQAAKRMIGISAHKWKVRATKKSVPEKGEKVVEEEGEKSEREAIDVERG